MSRRWLAVCLAVSACSAPAAVTSPPDAPPPEAPPPDATPDDPNAAASWTFGDCFANPLDDGNGARDPAYRTDTTLCGMGPDGNDALYFLGGGSMVTVPGPHSFGFGHGFTVAAWVAPMAPSGDAAIFHWGDDAPAPSALTLSGGRLRVAVGLASGTSIDLSAPGPIAADGQFKHVAATYDGATLILYVQGVEVARRDAPGALSRVIGDLFIGNDPAKHAFVGTIARASVHARALSAADIAALACVVVPPTVTLEPQGAELAAGTSTSISISVANNDAPLCAPLSVTVTTQLFVNGLTIDPATPTTQLVASGGVARFELTASAAATMDAGSFFLDIDVNFGDSRDAFQSFLLTVDERCPVQVERELMITDLSVVEDPVRAAGVWSFKHLVENLAPTPADAPALVEDMLDTFGVAQTLNGFTIDASPSMKTMILDRWPRTPAGALDLAQAPLRLLAIVNRVDRRDLAHGDAGEGRFVFGFTDGTFDGSALQATMILEYKLPAATAADAVGWAQAFHALGAQPFSESYNAALEAITERFVARGARPDHVNGSAIASVRTHTGLDGFAFQMRTFALSAATGRLVPVLADQTPDLSFNNTDALARFIQGNRAAIGDGSVQVPDLFETKPFRAAVALRNGFVWQAPGVDSDTRHAFAMLTCNGCHSSEETGTDFQLSPRFAGEPSFASIFLTSDWPDPMSGQFRALEDLARRKADLKTLVCTDLTTARAHVGRRAALPGGH
jgi:hypothetical protein